MQKHILFLLLLCWSGVSLAQEKGINYQTIIRDQAGTALANQPISLGFSIIYQDQSGAESVVYRGLQRVTTNAFGLINVVIGDSADVFSPPFGQIDWAEGEHLLEISLNGSPISKTQLESVPYAKVATDMSLSHLKDVEVANPSLNDALIWNGQKWVAGSTGSGGTIYSAGPGIIIQNDSILNSAPDIPVSLSGTGATSVSGTYPNFVISSVDNTTDADADPANEIQTLSKSGNSVSLSQNGGSFTDEVNDADADPGNELQTLTINGDTISISGGNYINLPPSQGGTSYSSGTGINITNNVINNSAPDQTVTLAGGGATTVSGTYPNFNINSTDNVNDADADPGNEIQSLSKSGNTVTLSKSGGSFTDAVNDADADPGNEIQILTKLGSSVSLSQNGGSFTDEVNDADADPGNEIQVISKSGNTVSLSQSGGSFTDEVNDADADPNNEIQVLTLSGQVLTLDNGGGFVTLPDNNYVGGNGISISGNTITNDFPDQTVSINGSGATVVSGTYPNFTVSSTDNVNDADANPSNELQIISKSGNLVSLSQSGGSFTDETDDADADPNNEIQTLSKSGNTVSLSQSGGSFIDEVNDADADPNNEIQVLTLSGQDLTLDNGGGTITLPTSNYVGGSGISISGNTINNDFPDQTVAINGSGATVVSGTYPNFTVSSTDNVNDADANPSNELQIISKSGNLVTLSQSGGSFTDETDDADADPNNEIQTLSKSGNTISLSQGGGSFTDEVDDADADPNNEIQTLTLSGQVLTLDNGGGFVTLPDNNYVGGNGISISGNTITNDFPDQNVSINGSGATIVSGTYPNFTVSSSDNVNDADANPNNELQIISKSGNLVTLSQSGGSFTDETDDADADPNNEIQTISKSGNTVSLSQSGGSFIDETDDADADPINEIQSISKSGNVVSLSQSGGSFTDEVDDADADPINEIQTLSKSGSTVFLSQGGGSFVDEVNDYDPDPFNEIQSLTLIGQQLSLDNGGGSVTLPSASVWNVNSNDVYFDTGNVGIGLNNPQAGLHLDSTQNLLIGHAASGKGSRLYYNTEKVALRIGNLNNNLSYWDLDSLGFNSFASGLEGRAVGNNSFVAGGGQNAAIGYSSFSGAGYSNRAFGNNSFIGGGSYNEARGEWSFVGAGYYNIASGKHSFIGGGFQLRVSGQDAFAGGGSNNEASGSSSVILGGGNNLASGSSTFIAAGIGNTTSGGNSFASGTGNTTSGNSSFSAGGGFNTASGSNSFIGGGVGNTAPSYGEAVFGTYATTYTPTGGTFINSNDRLFVVGNGTSSSNRNDALTILKNGRIGINNSTPFAQLSVSNSSLGTGVAIGQNFSSTFSTYGMDISNTNPSGNARGGIFLAYSQATNASSAYGIFTYAWNDNGTGPTYGIFSSAVNGSSIGVKYAGYFSGDVYTTGLYLPSDQVLKSNIQKAPSSLKKLMDLEISTYSYRRDQYPQMNLPEGKRTGFIAQNVAELMPELVRKAIQPETEEKLRQETGLAKEKEVHFTAVDYAGMAPYIVKAMQEQQAQIEEQQAKIESQQAQIDGQQAEINALKAERKQLHEIRQQLQLLQQQINSLKNEK